MKLITQYKSKFVSFFSSLILILAASCSSTDDIDRTQKPEPGEAPEIQMGDYEKVTLDNGMKVFIVKDQQSPMVSFNFEIDRKPVLEEDKKGYVSLAGEMLGTATENRTNDELNEAIDFMGADFYTNPKGLYASALKKHHEELLSITSDVLRKAVFTKEEFDKAKKQTLSGLKSSEENPGQIASRVYDRLIFSPDHPYGEVEKPETIENIELTDIQSYYEKFFNPGNMYLAVVGDVSKETILTLIKDEFGDWKGDSAAQQAVEQKPKPPETTQIGIVNRSSASQSSLRVGHPVQLERKDDHFFAARLMNTILGRPNFRLFMNLREEHAYTYGAYSRLSADQQVGKFQAIAEVDNNATDSAINQVIKEMQKIRNEKVDSSELKRAQNYLTGNFAIGLEDARTVANYAINQAKKDLPENFYQNYLKNINQVTREEVQKAAKALIHPKNAHILVVGKSSAFRGKLNQFGEVNYYDEYGKPVESPEIGSVPEGMTAEKVIDSYIKAIGGGEKLASIEGYQLNYQTSMQGRTLNLKQKQMAPAFFRYDMQVGGMTQQTQVFDGDQGYVKSMRTGKKPIEGRQLKRMKVKSRMFYLNKRNELNLETELKGMASIKGNPAYEIEITTEDGLTWTEYFAKNSFYRVAEESKRKTPQGEVTQTTYYNDYEEKDGITFPGSITQSMGQRTFTFDLLMIELNPGLKKSDFKLDS